jgi:two-component system cell cycle response regulator CpdR
MRILYVEDNALVREVTSELLAQDERQILCCGNAEDALQEFGDKAFDLVITDVSLPMMSGIDFARSILRAKPHMPIIIASGYALDFGHGSWGQNVRFVIKPFGPDEIERLIDELLSV